MSVLIEEVPGNAFTEELAYPIPLSKSNEQFTETVFAHNGCIELSTVAASTGMKIVAINKIANIHIIICFFTMFPPFKNIYILT